MAGFDPNTYFNTVYSVVKLCFYVIFQHSTTYLQQHIFGTKLAGNAVRLFISAAGNVDIGVEKFPQIILGGKWYNKFKW